MQSPQKNLSQSSQVIRLKAKFIYEHLIKLGYPKILELSLSKPEQIQTYLATYFQCTPSRLQLIEWLIAAIMPQYRQMSWYVTEKDPLQKILKSLWRIGVMPVNKHTKNLDYKKYLQAAIGYQNAVNLIFSLVQLAYETVLSKKSKQDVTFGQFLHQTIDNFTQLVNENYDLYGIAFPCKFIDPNQVKNQIESDQTEEYLDEFQKQYNKFYQEKMLPLLQKEDQLFNKIYSKKQNKKPILTQNASSSKKNTQKEEENPESELEKFVLDLSIYGREYHGKYKKLVDKIDVLLKAPQTKSRLMPYYLQQKQQHDQNEQKSCVKETMEKRSIKISSEFCRKYHEYKKILRQIKVPKDDKQFMLKRGQILEDLYKVNENVVL